jgi:hypothetical protein
MRANDNRSVVAIGGMQTCLKGGRDHGASKKRMCEPPSMIAVSFAEQFFHETGARSDRELD